MVDLHAKNQRQRFRQFTSNRRAVDNEFYNLLVGQTDGCESLIWGLDDVTSTLAVFSLVPPALSLAARLFIGTVAVECA